MGQMIASLLLEYPNLYRDLLLGLVGAIMFLIVEFSGALPEIASLLASEPVDGWEQRSADAASGSASGKKWNTRICFLGIHIFAALLSGPLVAALLIEPSDPKGAVMAGLVGPSLVRHLRSNFVKNSNAGNEGTGKEENDG